MKTGITGWGGRQSRLKREKESDQEQVKTREKKGQHAESLHGSTPTIGTQIFTLPAPAGARVGPVPQFPLRINIILIPSIHVAEAKSLFDRRSKAKAATAQKNWS